MSDEKKKVTLNSRKRIEAYEKLKERLHKAALNPAMWEYEDGWNDARIADEIEVPGATHSVANIRREMFGHLIGSGYGKNLQDASAALDLVVELASRIEKIERNIKRLAIEAGVELKDNS